MQQKESKKTCTHNKILSTAYVETHFVSSVEKSNIGQLIAKCLRTGKSKIAVKVKI
jgi:acyl-CoA hydrolase